MLRELRVGNLALAEDLCLELGPGLTMLTGETGAGKSLIAGALSLLTGVKADRGLIREGQELAWVEGLFDLSEQAILAAEVAALGLPLGADGVLVLRRELRAAGRGRVLINGLVSSLVLLEQVGKKLLAVQSQDQQRLLGRATFAQEFLDNALDLAADRELVRQRREIWRSRQTDLGRRRQEEEFARQQLEMWEYQHRELEGMGLDPAEEAELAEQLALGRNARAVLEAADKARTDLTEDQSSARFTLGAAEAVLRPVAAASARLTAILDLIQGASEAVSEAGQELERFLDGAVVDPERLDEMEERKAQYEELRRKYDCDVAGLVALRDDLAGRISRQKSAGRNIVALAEEVERAQAELASAAAALRAKRRRGAAKVARQACELIRPLALPDIELEFAVTPRPAAADGIDVDGAACEITTSGADIVRLLARTNRGEKRGEVAEIASGGERSRIFLGLSVLMRRPGAQPLLLFDEIDAGLGMDNAIPVAGLLADLATSGQVVCITHLATVAARGEAHLLAAKSVVGKRTVLAVRNLGPADRLQEIARLLGGEAAGAAGAAGSRLAYAKQLLARA